MGGKTNPSNKDLILSDGKRQGEHKHIVTRMVELDGLEVKV
jgi:hypothetical protein